METTLPEVLLVEVVDEASLGVLVVPWRLANPGVIEIDVLYIGAGAGKEEFSPEFSPIVVLLGKPFPDPTENGKTGM